MGAREVVLLQIGDSWQDVTSSAADAQNAIERQLLLSLELVFNRRVDGFHSMGVYLWLIKK